MSNLCSDLHIIIRTNINIIPGLEYDQLSTVFKLKAAQLVFQMCLFEFSVVTWGVLASPWALREISKICFDPEILAQSAAQHVKG